MVASRKAADPPANRLLGLLPPRDYERLRPHLHRIPLEYRQSLYRAHKPIGFVYFIETGVGSLVNTMANGQASEVGTIGNEGLVGLPHRVRRRQGAHQRLHPGSRCRPENEGSAIQKGTGAKRFDAHRDAALCPRFLQPGRAVRRVQSISFHRAALLPLDADDARPHAIGRVSAHAGVPGHDARRAANRRHGCGRHPATGRPHPLQARQRHHHRPPRPDAPLVRMLRRFQEGVRSSARRSSTTQGSIRQNVKRLG